MQRAGIAIHHCAQAGTAKSPGRGAGSGEPSYRDGLDYQSAAIMQFNAAATEHALGDQGDAAISALEAAIAMDRDFGFRDDAYAGQYPAALRHWRGEDESDASELPH